MANFVDQVPLTNVIKLWPLSGLEYVYSSKKTEEWNKILAHKIWLYLLKKQILTTNPDFFFLYCRNQWILRKWLCGSPRAVSDNSIAYPLWSVAGSWRTRCVHPQDLFRSDFRNPTTIIYTNWSVIVLALLWYFICIFSRIEFIM